MGSQEALGRLYEYKQDVNGNHQKLKIDFEKILKDIMEIYKLY